MKKIHKIAALMFVSISFISSQSMSASTAKNLKCKGCVGSSDIAKNAVTSSRIKSNSVTTSKIKNGSVNFDKLGPDVQVILDTVGSNDTRITALAGGGLVGGGTVAVDCVSESDALLLPPISGNFTANTTYNITGSCNGPINISSDGVHLVGQEANATSSIVLPAGTASPGGGAVFVGGGNDVRIENLLLDASAWADAGAEGSDSAGLYIRSAFVRLIDSKVVGGIYGVSPYRDALLRMEGTNDITGFVNAGISVGDNSTLTGRGQVNVSTTNNAASGFTDDVYTSAIETYRQGVVDFRKGLTVSVPADIPGFDYYPEAISVGSQSSVRVRDSGTVTIQGRAQAYQQSVLNIQGGTVTGDLGASVGSHLSVSGSTVTGDITVNDNSVGNINSSSTITGNIGLNTNSSLRLNSSTFIGDLDVRVNSTVTSWDSAHSGGAVLAQASSTILFEGSSTVAPVNTLWAGTGSLFAFAGTAAITYNGELNLSHNSILRAENNADLGSASGTTINCQSKADQVDIWTGGSNNVTGVAYNACP